MENGPDDTHCHSFDNIVWILRRSSIWLATYLRTCSRLFTDKRGTFGYSIGIGRYGIPVPARLASRLYQSSIPSGGMCRVS